jgi:hypothetical protein
MAADSHEAEAKPETTADVFAGGKLLSNSIERW